MSKKTERLGEKLEEVLNELKQDIIWRERQIESAENNLKTNKQELEFKIKKLERLSLAI